MARPAKRKKSITKSMVLHAASKLFLKQGYVNTRIIDIANEANVSYNEVFRICVDKDTILSELVGLVVECQFKETHEILKDVTNDKILIYAFETVLQLYMAETIEHIREMYSVSYSLPRSSYAIYEVITDKLAETFKEHLPHYQTKDFFELEIASAGIMRGYITIPCDMYFTIDRKVRRFLESTFRVFKVDEEKIEEAIQFVSKYDFKPIAYKVIDSLYDYLSDNT